ASSPTARLIPVWRAALKPDSSAFTSYLPTGRDNTRYVPVSLVLAVRPAPVSRLVTVTLAPGTAAPEESSTLPETVAVTCALIVPTAKEIQRRAANVCADNFLSESMLHPPPIFLVPICWQDYTPICINSPHRRGGREA